MERFEAVVAGLERHVLKNGLTLLLREDHSTPIVTSMVWYRVGSRFENLGRTGISHFLEHMMFKGTPKFGKGVIDDITALHGGTNNAFTANDYTAYYFSFASDRWNIALEMEADRMVNLLLDPVEFDLERQVILEEMKMERDHPWGLLRQEIEWNSFGSHPYRFPIIGLPDDVEKLSPAQMEEHYRTFYVPSNAVLVVVGDIEKDRVLDQVKWMFEGIEGGGRSETYHPFEERTGQIRFEVRQPTRVTRMMMAFPAPSVRDPEHYSYDLLDKILSEGKLSRLHHRLVEQEQLASYVSTDFADTFDPYIMSLRLELLDPRDLGKAEEIVFEELGRVSREEPNPAELERAKTQARMSFLGSMETSLDQAVQFGLMEALGGIEYWWTYVDRIEAVTAADVSATAERYLSSDRAVIGILSNGNNRSN